MKSSKEPGSGETDTMINSQRVTPLRSARRVFFRGVSKSNEFPNLSRAMSADLLSIHESTPTGSVPLDSGNWQSLRTYRYDHTFKDCPTTHYHKTIHFVYSTMPSEIRERWIGWLKYFNLYFVSYQEQVTTNAKLVTVFVNKYRERFVPFWQWFINLEHMLPWVKIDKSDVIEINSNVRKTFDSDVEHDISGNYIARYRKYCSRWVTADLSVDMPSMPTFDEFIFLPHLYGTSGAGEMRDVIIKLNGVRTKAKNTKWAWTLNDRLPNAKRWMQAKLSIKKKEKPPKKRTVSKIDLDSYLYESYISMFVEARRSRSYGTLWSSPLAETSTERFEREQDWSRRVQSNESIAATDASSFDVHYSKEEIKAYFLAVADLAAVEKWPHWEDVVTACAIMQEKVDNIKIETNLFGITTEFTHRRGLISGMRSTSLLGTAKSSIVANMALDDCGLRQNCTVMSTNGDDMLAMFTQGTDVKIFTDQVHEDKHIFTNEQKTLISPTSRINMYEYLKKINASQPYTFYKDTNISTMTGVPVRATSSLLLRSPESNVELPSITSIVSNWMRYYMRGGRKDAIMFHMVNDLSRMLSQSKDIVRSYLGTPSSFGGAGISWFRTTDYYKIEEKQLIRNNVEIITRGKWRHYELSDRFIVSKVGGSLVRPSPIRQSFKKTAVHVKFHTRGQRLDYKLHFNKDVDKPWLNQIMFESWLFERNWDDWTIPNLVLAEDSAAVLYRLFHKWSRALWYKWVEGKLFPGFRVPGWSDATVSSYLEIAKEETFGWLASRRSSLADLRVANYNIELNSWRINNSNLSKIVD
jgi:hypothetical protein